MQEIKQKIVDFLIANADPSIVLRVKKEILYNLSEKEENELLNRIIPQKKSKRFSNHKKTMAGLETLSMVQAPNMAQVCLIIWRSDYVTSWKRGCRRRMNIS